MKKDDIRNISRRRFIRDTTLGAAGLAVSGSLSGVLFPGTLKGRSKVVFIRNPKAVEPNGKVHIPLLKAMVRKGITEFSGESDLKKAWGKFIPPGKPLGIKLNTLGLSGIRRSSYTDHYGALTGVLTDELTSGGTELKDMIIWDRSDRELDTGGLDIQKKSGMLRVMGVKSSRNSSNTADEYHPDIHDLGGKSVRLAKILTDHCESLITVPILKHHHNAGITGSLKSHFGTIDNPRQFHGTGCVKPGIPELNALPEIRKKQKLVIADALMALINGGPWWSRRFIVPFGGILIGTDPVAVDAVLLTLMDELRESKGMDILKPNVPQLKLSEKLGIGVSDLNQIDIKRFDLSVSA